MTFWDWFDGAKTLSAEKEIKRLTAELYTCKEQAEAALISAVDARDALIEELNVIHQMACYASEEDTDSREKVLLNIGERARAAIKGGRL